MNREEIKTLSENNFISAWKVHDSDLMDKIVDYFENNQEDQNEGVFGFDQINKQYKNTTDIAMSPKKIEIDNLKIFKDYISDLNKCLIDYQKQWEFFGKTFSNLHTSTFNIQKYEEGGHVKRWHTERSGLSTSHRMLAWITYLNDVEKDGETEFHYYNLKIKPEKGKTVIWPSEWTHAHRGNSTPTIKYVITGWFHFGE